MGRHLVLTVHGIGEQKPGETVDAVVGAATTRFPGIDRVPVTVERDLIQLAEEEFDGTSRNAKLFPMHLRRVRPVDGDDETLFAEVYWADRSPAPVGPFRTIFDLLRVVLGLGYLAMDNVENNRGWFPTGVVHLFTWVFYGLVAPLNAILAIFFGLLVFFDGSESVIAFVAKILLGMDFDPSRFQSLSIVQSDLSRELRQWYEIPLSWVFFFQWALSLGLGLLTMIRANTYVVRIFGRGLAALGAVTLLFWEYDAFGGILHGDSYFDTHLVSHLTNLDTYITYSISTLGIAWAVVVMLSLMSYCTLIFRQEHHPSHIREDHRNIYPSICAAMLLFWMIISGATWMALAEWAHENSNTFDVESVDLVNYYFVGPMGELLDVLSVAFVGLMAMVPLGVALAAVRAMNKELLYKQHELGSRVILNLAIQWLLFGALLTIAVSMLDYAYYWGGSDYLSGSCSRLIDATNSLGQALRCIRDVGNSIAAIAMLILFVILYRFSEFVAKGLGVVRDIVTYAVMRECMWRSSVAERRENFEERNAIDARFRRVLYYGAEALKPDRITVISHSQGTVITTQMLQNTWVKRKIAKLAEVRPSGQAPDVLLVTMGSPVTHIYRRYFRHFFQVALADMPERTIWHNIHRSDDFVGTTIDGVDGLAGNWAVPAGGHTGYFTDFHVWDRLWNKVGFRLF
ncbi:hypothetical protein [uncultured Roseobacter sp.]|uniref:hypothetical protein n=1 Tax=uncultured Roseobacter sp. TaxID=114847 RepID=UPI0026266841|nr:hypothetical protein [uncultured Roseobacter sp.]